MARPVIISCAVTGAGDSLRQNPNVPVTPEQIASECIAAARAGAAVVHIHVRDPATGKPSMALEHYREVVERIRASDTPVLINLTTGAGARFNSSEADPKVGDAGTTLATPEKRVEHVLTLKPDICSLDVATMNWPGNAFVNTPRTLERMAELIRSSGVKPELEVFDLGHVRHARDMVERGLIIGKPLFQLCLGVPWGAPASTEAMVIMKNDLPPGALWASFGIARHQFPMVAQAVVLGGHVRVGLEDNLYLAQGVLAPGNAALVERAVDIIEAIGERPASVDEARAILELA